MSGTGTAPIVGTIGNPIYITRAQLCERLCISTRTAEVWATSGDGPPWVRLGKRRVVYKLSDVLAWEASRTFAHRAGELSGTAVERKAA